MIKDIRFEQEKAEYEQELKLRKAALQYAAAQREGKPFDLAEFGFEFSTAHIETVLSAQTGALSPNPAQRCE